MLMRRGLDCGGKTTQTAKTIHFGGTLKKRRLKHLPNYPRRHIQINPYSTDDDDGRVSKCHYFCARYCVYFFLPRPSISSSHLLLLLRIVCPSRRPLGIALLYFTSLSLPPPLGLPTTVQRPNLNGNRPPPPLHFLHPFRRRSEWKFNSHLQIIHLGPTKHTRSTQNQHPGISSPNPLFHSCSVPFCFEFYVGNIC